MRSRHPKKTSFWRFAGFMTGLSSSARPKCDGESPSPARGRLRITPGSTFAFWGRGYLRLAWKAPFG